MKEEIAKKRGRKKKPEKVLTGTSGPFVAAEGASQGQELGHHHRLITSSSAGAFREPLSPDTASTEGIVRPVPSLNKYGTTPTKQQYPVAINSPPSLRPLNVRNYVQFNLDTVCPHPIPFQMVRLAT